MRTISKTIAAIVSMAAMMMVLPAFAAADTPICHNGILSDDAGQGCADGLYAQVYGSGGGSNDGAICHDGILSNDVSQGCSDSFRSTNQSSSASSSSYNGGSSNSMVNPNCESGGNSQIVSANGLYWSKYQFDRATWIANGGSPDSYGSASAGEQDRVASRVTYDAWPNC
jgi:hypothetical protein